MRPMRSADRRNRRSERNDRRLTALPEQVTTLWSECLPLLRQRCSALRVLFIQNDVADSMLEMIAGAMRELVIGDPPIRARMSDR